MRFEELRPGMVVENAICRWTILGRPYLVNIHQFSGEGFYKVKARCEFKVATYSAREVELGGSGDVEVIS